MPFLPPDQQRQSTEGNAKVKELNKIQSKNNSQGKLPYDPHHFLNHQLTPDRKDASTPASGFQRPETIKSSDFIS